MFIYLCMPCVPVPVPVTVPMPLPACLSTMNVIVFISHILSYSTLPRCEFNEFFFSLSLLLSLSLFLARHCALFVFCSSWTHNYFVFIDMLYLCYHFANERKTSALNSKSHIFEHTHAQRTLNKFKLKKMRQPPHIWQRTVNKKKHTEWKENEPFSVLVSSFVMYTRWNVYVAEFTIFQRTNKIKNNAFTHIPSCKWGKKNP